MAKQTILTKNQAKLLKIVSQDDDICQNFYLTGGTALAEFYLWHRLSEDLDFFSKKEFDPQPIFIFFKGIQSQLGIKKIETNQSYNRYFFFLHLAEDIIKTEFTYFPFTCIAEGLKKDRLVIDSLLDIAVNKIFSIYQKPKARDFIDIYFILQQHQDWSIADLLKKARKKFDWHIDLLQLGSQFLVAETLKDYPRMIKRVEHHKWQDLFSKEAKKFKNDILK